jgi:hypothetical protein
MISDFDPQTKEKAGGRACMLLRDGHSSHFTPELLKYAMDNNITILRYPLYCTHALQGLDVVCFMRMKASFNEEISMFKETQQHGIKKANFTGTFGCAFIHAFTSDLIIAAFYVTGICSFDQNVITADQMKPSEESSTCSAFPLPYSSPTQAVLAAFTNYQPASFESHKETQPIAGPSQFSGVTTAPDTPGFTVPMSLQ